MLVFYEKVCREAGLSDEETAAIRAYLDGEKKKMRRDKKRRRQYGLSLIHGYDMDDLSSQKAVDAVEAVVEERMYQSEMAQQIAAVLNEMDAEDRKIIQNYLNGTSLTQIAEEMSLPRHVVQYRKEILMRQLRERICI